MKTERKKKGSKNGRSGKKKKSGRSREGERKVGGGEKGKPERKVPISITI